MPTLGLFADYCVIQRRIVLRQGDPEELSLAPHVLLTGPMFENIILMPGPTCFNLGAVHGIAQGFGWTVETADDIHKLAAAQAHRRTTAILFHREAFGSCSWLDALRLMRLALPGVRPIACHGFSEPVDWPTLCDAGAFHSLWLPLKEDEVRRSLGFIWQAEKRRAESAEKNLLFVPARKAISAQRITQDPARGTHALAMACAASGKLLV
jgi:hypothetical protein